MGVDHDYLHDLLHPRANALSVESLMLMEAIEAEERVEEDRDGAADGLRERLHFRVTFGAVMQRRWTLRELSDTIETFFELRCQPLKGVGRWRPPIHSPQSLGLQTRGRPSRSSPPSCEGSLASRYVG
jgi:hypothetical protein